MTKPLWLALVGVLALGAAAAGVIWQQTREGSLASQAVAVRVEPPPAPQAPPTWPPPSTPGPGAPALPGAAMPSAPGMPPPAREVGALPPGVMRGPAVVPLSPDPEEHAGQLVEARQRRLVDQMDQLNRRAAARQAAQGKGPPPGQPAPSTGDPAPGTRPPPDEHR